MGSLFWGGLLIVIGLQLLFNALFGIDLPLLRIAFGLWVLYWGLSLVMGTNPFKSSFGWHHKYTSQSVTYNTHTTSSSTIFSTQKIDLTTLDFGMQHTISHNTVFGTTYIEIPYEIPVLINAQAVFCTIMLPNNSTIHGGFERYQNVQMGQEPILILNVSAVFGTIIITFV
ncbi:MAG TPA: hypothetical protein VGW78_04980 [Candidatus Babeliales bacterium]|jgi:hypothetical protein|nr:hypothetical protein [Candidatus Babeliales bacterium]